MDDEHDERWRDVPGHAGLYSVSNQGRVRRNSARVLRRTTRRSPHFAIWRERTMTPTTSTGYCTVSLCRDGVRSRVYIHRLVYEVFVGPIPAGWQINHIDGARDNNAASNLEAVTPKGNMAHAARLGLVSRGERHPNARLSDVAARTAYERVVLHGERISHVAADLGVHRELIGSLTRGESYRHLGLERVVFGSNGRPIAELECPDIARRA